MKRFMNTLALFVVIILFLFSFSFGNPVLAAPQANPICGTWLRVTSSAGGFTFEAFAILPDGAANPYVVPGASGYTAGNRYCVYDPVVEPQSPPVSTNEGYDITEKISSYSSIQPDNGSAPSPNFDAWPLEGDAPLEVKMHIVSTSGISSCFWEYGDGLTGASCEPEHYHTYISSGSYTVKLTVSGPGGSNSLQRDNYIKVNEPNISCPSQLRAEYFSNQTLSGSPSLIQCEDMPIDHTWNGNSPGANIPSDIFSSRWTGNISLQNGDYAFSYQSDDGMRVWLNDELIIDNWINPSLDTGRVTIPLVAGDYKIKIEHYNSNGWASARLRWEWQDTTVCPNQYRAEYYPNQTLSGYPSLVQCENWPVNHNWQGSGPGYGVPANTFSSRWIGHASLQSGSYSFIYQSDDGMRAWLGNDLLIDNWDNPSLNESQVSRDVATGEYLIKVEHYNSNGWATAKFRWESVPQTGGMSGHFLDRDGNPIANVTVKAESNGKTYTTQANSLDGVFGFDNLPAGTYIVTPSKAGYGFEPLSQTIIVPSVEAFFIEFRGSPCISSATKLDTCTLQIGDILLAKGEFSGIAQVARSVIGTYWFHAAIYLGGGNLAHATGPTPTLDSDQVKTDSIYNTYWWSGIGLNDWAVIRPVASTNIKEEAATYAKSKADQKAPYILYNTNYFEKNVEDRFYCSQLVWQAYKKQTGGPDLEANRGILTSLFSEVVTADDLYYSIYENKAQLVQEKGGSSSLPERAIFWIFSPAKLLLVDPIGRRTGYDARTNTIVKEIPNADYFSHDEGIETLSIQSLDLNDGTWSLIVNGTGNGSYTLAAEVIDLATPLNQKLTLETEPGKVDVFQISNLGSQDKDIFNRINKVFLPLVLQ